MSQKSNETETQFSKISTDRSGDNNYTEPRDLINRRQAFLIYDEILDILKTKMTDKQLCAFKLWLHGYTAAAISEELNMEKHAVESLLTRARLKAMKFAKQVQDMIDDR